LDYAGDANYSDDRHPPPVLPPPVLPPPVLKALETLPRSTASVAPAAAPEILK
jgi:hypothetical protein